MKKSGGIIALIAGIFGFFAAIATLFVGGVGGAVGAEDANTVVGLGWGGVFFSFVVIVLGSIAIGAETKKPGIFLIASSILGAILGGTMVAITMALAIVGGIIATIGVKNPVKESKST